MNESDSRLHPDVRTPQFIVTMTLIAVTGLYDFAVTFFHPILDKQLLTVILTSLNAGGILVAVQYWLGSSASSRNKDETIATIAKK